MLKKIFTELLNKKFIRVSYFSAAAFIFLIKKFKKNIRFYINYRELNAIIRKDRYFFFITETLRNIAKIK